MSKDRKKQLNVGLIFIQVVFILFFIIKMVNFEGYVSSNSGYPASVWSSNYIRYDYEKGWYVDSSMISTDDRIDLLYGPYLSLDRGSYAVKVDYVADDTQSMEVHSNSMGSFIKTGGDNLERTGETGRVAYYEFDITDEITDLEVIARYNGQGKLWIKNIEIVETRARAFGMYMLILAVWIIFDCFYFWSDFFKRHKTTITVLAGIALFSSIPLLYAGLNNGHDLSFHMVRIEGLAQELLFGVFPSRIQSTWCNGYGYPVSIYYGDFMLYLPAVLRIIGIPVIKTYKIYIFLVNILSTLVTYFCMKKMFRKHYIAYLVTLAYMVCSYRLTDVYIRAAVGEYGALLFLPLVALGIWKIYDLKTPDFTYQLKCALALGIGVAGVCCNHVLSVEMLVLLLVVLVIILIRQTFNVKVIQTYIMSVVVCMCVGGWYIIPFLDYYKNEVVHVNTAFTGGKKLIQGVALYLSDYVDFFKSVYGLNREFQLTPGLLLMLALAAGVYFICMRVASRRTVVLCILAAIVIWVSSNTFPWDVLAQDTDFGQFMAQIQYPWRYLSQVCIILSVLLGDLFLTLDKLSTTENRNMFYFKPQVVAGFAGLIAVIMACAYYSDYFSFSGSDPVNWYNYYEMSTFPGSTWDYLPYDNDREEYTMVTDTPGNIVCGNIDSAKQSSRVSNTMIIDVVNNRADEGYMEVPMFYLLHYKACVVGGEELKVSRGYNSSIMVKVPGSFNGQIKVYYDVPVFWRAAEVISWITSVLAIIMILYLSFPAEFKVLLAKMGRKTV